MKEKLHVILARHMESANLSAQGLSKKIGMKDAAPTKYKLSRVAIHNILKGTTSPNLNTLELIATALGISVCDLIDSTKTPIATSDKLEMIKQLSDEVLAELNAPDGE